MRYKRVRKWKIKWGVKVQDLDGATCTSLYWASNACTRRCLLKGLGLKWSVLTGVDDVKRDDK